MGDLFVVRYFVLIGPVQGLLRHCEVFRSFLMGVCLLAVTCRASQVRAQIPTPEVTKEHKLLQRDVGVWDVEMKVWTLGPAGDPMVSKGVERNRMLGDYWLVSDFTVDLGGQNVCGHGQNGYDPVKKKFVGTWIDTMSTSISPMEGTYDEKTGEMTMTMTGIDPGSGEGIKSKSVSKHRDDNTRVFTIFMQAPSGSDTWVKSMEVTYTRRDAWCMCLGAFVVIGGALPV